MIEHEKDRALRPATVVKTYAPLVGGPVKAREIIALALQEGTLKARAAHRWISGEPDLSRAWQREPDKENFPRPTAYQSQHDIKASDWQKSISFTDDMMLWDFRRSRLHITLSRDPSRRIMMRDLRLNKTDTKNVFLFADAPGASKFGRVHKRDDWRSFWHEVLLLAAAGPANAKSSLLGQSKNDVTIVNTVIARIAGQPSYESSSEMSDQDVARFISSQLSFNLSEHSILAEVKLLRQNLRLKREYASRGKSLGLGSLSKTGSAGNTRRNSD